MLNSLGQKDAQLYIKQIVISASLKLEINKINHLEFISTEFTQSLIDVVDIEDTE